MKKLITIFLISLTLVSVTACNKNIMHQSMDIKENIADVNTVYIDFVVLEKTGWYVVAYDKLTLNMYLVIDGYQSSAMTPIYDIEGNIKKYEVPTNE